MASNYTVISVTEDQSNDAAGNLVDVYDINFTIPGATGSFQVQVPQGGDVVAAANAAIEAKAAAVDGILAL
jgi:hypothetical protein